MERSGPGPGHCPDQVNPTVSKRIQVIVCFLQVFHLILRCSHLQEPPQFRRGLEKGKKKSFEGRKPECTRDTKDLRHGCRLFYFYESLGGGQEGLGPGIDTYVFTEKTFHIHTSREPEHPHDL